MIIVKLMGGLGNQMFQYAAAKYLSIIHNTSIKLDLSYLNADTNGAYTKRKYELGILNIKEDFATKNDINPYKKIAENFYLRNIHKHFSFLFPYKYGKEYGHGYNKNFVKFPSSTYLDGFWQSEKYFKPIEKIIKEEFIFNNSLSGLNEAMAKKINNCESIGIHIRRTDYITNKQVMRYHGTCDLDYYYRAIDIISRKVSLPCLFVFSDDSEWVKQNFKSNCPFVCIDNNSNADFEDMRMMSMCKHNVIANSSFGWWASWLNNNPDKIIVAPIKWFNNTTVNSKDIIPEEWIKI
ncbi:MAG: alpha-1,2-fucosyltransferase [Bacteroidota bacterium]